MKSERPKMDVTQQLTTFMEAASVAVMVLILTVTQWTIVIDISIYI